MIRVEHVCRRYGDLTAVDRVSLSIERGEIVGLLGHNGAGKTTLMQMLTGFIEPTSGTISVAGYDVQQQRLEAQRKIGYLPETAPLYPEMTVQDYLLTMADLRGVPAELRTQAVARAAAGTDLRGRMLQPIRTLSKGYRQRVGLAQAIVHEPDVLILDEPTNGLDPAQIVAIRKLVRSLGERTTVLLSTHILQEVEAVCERVLVMIDGALALDAPLSELLTSRTLRLALGTEQDPSAVLTGLPGIRAVRSLGPEPGMVGFHAYALDCEPGDWPTDNVARTCADQGWTLGALAPEQRTLDGVFRELQSKRAGGGHPS